MVRFAGSNTGLGGGGRSPLAALRCAEGVLEDVTFSWAMVGCIGLPRCESSVVQTESLANRTHILDRQGLNQMTFISAATVLCAAFALRQALRGSELTLVGFVQKTTALVCPELGVNATQLQQFLV